MTYRLTIAVLLLGIICAVVLFVGATTVKANPSSIIEAKTATATTTLSFMTPGTATTTKVFDLQSDAAPADTAALLIRFNSSSSQSVLKWRYEYAQSPGFLNGVFVDCLTSPGQCDWFSESINNAASTATTSIEVRDFKEYSWQFASSTPGGVATAQDNGLKMVIVPSPTRYLRVVFYLGIGGASTTNGGVWADLAFKRENR